MDDAYIEDLLNEKLLCYYRPEFISEDPVCIPRLFNRKEDIEIAALLTAVISWGSRVSIIRTAAKWMEYMDNAPYDFILHYTPSDLKRLRKFFYRTFQPPDVIYFIKALRCLFKTYSSLEEVFFPAGEDISVEKGIQRFRTLFFSYHPAPRTRKHLSDPSSGSCCKRLCMFLRWMVRPCSKGIDFGIWKTVHPGDLKIPLDVHTFRAFRFLGMSQKKVPRWKDVLYLTERLKQFNPRDPLIYDFALFGLGRELKKEKF